MIENLQSINVFSPSYVEILLSLLVSLVCSYAISLIYRYTYRGVGYSLSFVHSIVFLSLITTLVIIGIGNNLARAFGLVGALSIVRFRTAVKDTADLVYIFLSLALGMSAGIGYHKLAFTGTGIIGLVLVIFSKTSDTILSSNRYLLQFNLSGNENTEPQFFVKLIDNYCSQYDIMNIRTDEINKSIVYSYNVRMRRIENADKMIRELRNVPGISSVNMFFDQQTV